jgi:hypothetical protein
MLFLSFYQLDNGRCAASNRPARRSGSCRPSAPSTTSSVACATVFPARNRGLRCSGERLWKAQHNRSYGKYRVMRTPEGCELGMMLNDHDLGAYPSIGVYWAFPAMEAPATYISRAEGLLSGFNQAVTGKAISFPSDGNERQALILMAIQFHTLSLPNPALFYPP